MIEETWEDPEPKELIVEYLKMSEQTLNFINNLCYGSPFFELEGFAAIYYDFIAV